jgi:hypothetical protein
MALRRFNRCRSPQYQLPSRASFCLYRREPKRAASLLWQLLRWLGRGFIHSGVLQDTVHQPVPRRGDMLSPELTNDDRGPRVGRHQVGPAQRDCRQSREAAASALPRRS